MGRDWKQWEGQVINGSFLLRQYLGGSDHSVVFLTERRGREPQRAAIKLIQVDPANTATQLARWELAAQLSHPHLLRLFETGSCQLDGQVLLYVVMEYAEESLAQIIPYRPLTPAEARDMLEPALDALAFIHGKSLVHGRLKPSNVMATQDQLRLSSDSLVRAGEPIGAAAPSVYDAPEKASGRISPASDSWSLGMTLMEALTQRLPARDGISEPMPETVPAPFMGIAHCCLRRDPERRCTAADIAARLRSTSSSPLAQSMAKAPTSLGVPAGTAKWRYVLPAGVLAMLGVALLIGGKAFNHGSGAPPASVSSQQSSASSSASLMQPASEQENAAGKVKPSPSATVAKPSARKSANRNQAPVVAAVSPVESIPAVSEAPAANSGQGQVVQQILPTLPKSATNTIHGTIKVRVKVALDSSGSVETASFVSPGPSKYFANRAMQAVQQWKFVPGQANSQDSRTRILRFSFKQSGTDAVVEPANP